MMASASPCIAWLGNNGWVIAVDGHMVATDLDLHLSERILPPFGEMEALARHLEYLFITHAHTDHCNPDTLAYLLENGSCTVVAAASCKRAIDSYGLDAARFVYVSPLPILRDVQNNPLCMPGVRYDTSQSPRLAPWIQALPIRALHGHVDGVIYAGAHPQDCGFLLDVCGVRIVQPGDSVLLQEHLDIPPVDVLFVSTTEHTMGARQAQRWVEAVEPKHIFAQHFGTYAANAENAFWTKGNEQALGKALPPALRRRYTVPEYMRVYTPAEA